MVLFEMKQSSKFYRNSNKLVFAILRFLNMIVICIYKLLEFGGKYYCVLENCVKLTV